MVMKKPEDTAEGCRSLAQADRTRAADSTSSHMRRSLERSAQAWRTRADLLDRLESSFNARAKTYADDQARRHSERKAHG
jgi:hypothetical protein